MNINIHNNATKKPKMTHFTNCSFMELKESENELSLTQNTQATYEDSTDEEYEPSTPVIKLKIKDYYKIK